LFGIGGGTVDEVFAIDQDDGWQSVGAIHKVIKVASFYQVSKHFTSICGQRSYRVLHPSQRFVSAGNF
jgi:hypothetical protein